MVRFERRGTSQRVGFLVLLIAILSLGCPTRPAADYSKLGNPRKEDFVIGPADVIRVSVWKLPDVNTDTRVRPDGIITVPLIGEVKAAGRTTRQLRDDVQARLLAYVKDSSTTVQVAVLEVNSYVVTVSGRVVRPDVYHLKEYVSVSEAIALAGGPTLYASPDDTIVIRPSGQAVPKRIPVQYTKILQGLAPEEDLVLYSGDTVYVP